MRDFYNNNERVDVVPIDDIASGDFTDALKGKDGVHVFGSLNEATFMQVLVL